MSSARSRRLLRPAPLALTAVLACVFVGQTTAQGLFRPIDGRGTNPLRPSWGATHEPLIRLSFADYADGTDAPAGPNRPNPRAVSNAVVRQTRSIPNSKGASSFLWQWGQFIDHDITFSLFAEHPRVPLDIPVPAGDPFFDPAGTGTQTIEFFRNEFVRDGRGVRQQTNSLTAYIDGSGIYGSDAARARFLRGPRGRLKMDARGFPPRNTAGFPNELDPNDTNLFLCGDARANEQTGLLSMHILWVREHNRIASMLPQFLPGELIYQISRTLVYAQVQSITYDEFLPMLVGNRALRPYRGWKPWVNPTIAQEFSAASFRLGHTLLPSELLVVDANGQAAPLALRDAFFRPDIVRRDGIEPYLRGLLFQPAQEVDNMVVEDVRSFLFGAPGQGGLDLPALNVQRAREHGLPGLADVRRSLGLRPIRRWRDVSSNPGIRRRLRSVYGSVDEIDLWVGGLCEDPIRGSMLGETLHTVVVDQFTRLRDGDPYFYKRILPWFLVRWIESRTLADVIRDNTTIGRELPDDVFTVPSRR